MVGSENLNSVLNTWRLKFERSIKWKKKFQNKELDAEILKNIYKTKKEIPRYFIRDYNPIIYVIMTIIYVVLLAHLKFIIKMRMWIHMSVIKSIFLFSLFILNGVKLGLIKW